MKREFGFSQDLLQNLQKYRDFDTYRNNVVEYNFLASKITATDDTLTLQDGYGFPDENGVLYIDDEIILYRTKTGNVFSGLGAWRRRNSNFTNFYIQRHVSRHRTSKAQQRSNCKEPFGVVSCCKCSKLSANRMPQT